MTQSRKIVQSSDRRRLYRTRAGAALQCTLVHDDDGYYGWCGYVADQSDYALGPYETPDEVWSAYKRRNPTHIRVQTTILYQDRNPEFRPLLQVV